MIGNTNVKNVEPGTYVGNGADGVYWRVWMSLSGGWHFSLVVEVPYCIGNLQQGIGPYSTRGEAETVAATSALAWCTEHGIEPVEGAMGPAGKLQGV